MALTKSEILSIGAPKTEEVEIEGVGVFTLRKLTGAGRHEFAKMAKEESAHAVPKLLALSIVVADESGALKQTFNNQHGLEALSQLDGEVIDKLAEAILKLNKMTKTEPEEVEKNSEIQSVDSTSD